MKTLFTCLLLSFTFISYAQADLMDSLMQTQKPKREYVSYTFKATRIISGHSIETVKKNAIDFSIVHRFGDMFGAPTNNYHTLFGFDQAADIGIIVEYGITSDLTIGVGRMKGSGLLTELWNGNIKYRILKQTKDFKIPFTITLLANTAISSMISTPDSTALNDFPKGYAGFAHRLSYLAQALIACKVNRWLSLQIEPTYLWRNVVPYGDQNGMFFGGLSGRAKVSNRTAIVWEYFLPLIKPGTGGREYFPMLRGIKNASYYPPLDIGMEFETGGHVFDVNLTNSTGILENDFLPYTSKNWAQGEFRMGFTISRTFPLGQGKKPGKYWKKGSIEDAN